MGANGPFATGAAPEGRVWSVAQVARVLHVSKASVYRLIRAGRIPATRVGGRYQVREHDVRRYSDEGFEDAG